MPERQLEVVRALRLGWLTSEIYGLVRHGALNYASRRLPPQERTGRLYISDRDLKNEVLRLELGLRALLRLAELLKVYDPAKEKTPLHSLATQMLEFLTEPRSGQALALGEVRAYLEAWSMDAWGILIARNESAARAFSYGASIGDTFWFMRRPKPERLAESDRETWEGLLRHGRLKEESERIGELAANLPPYVAVALKHSLSRWGIAGELKKYTRTDGEDQESILEPDVEKKMYSALSAQARIWRSIILGERTPENYVTPRDESRIRVWHNLLFIPLALVILFVLFFLVWLLVNIAGPFFFPSVWNLVINLQPQGQAPTLELKDIISSLSILAALLGGLWASGRWIFEQLFQLYQWLGSKMTERYIKQRTWAPWNRGLDLQEPPFSPEPEVSNG